MFSKSLAHTVQFLPLPLPHLDPNQASFNLVKASNNFNVLVQLALLRK